MAGYIKAYISGTRGGFDGADGISSFELVIGVGASDREWLKPLYYANRETLKTTIWKIEKIIPNPENYENSIIDAFIAFAPGLFEGCEILQKVASEIGSSKSIDFTNPKTIPKSWNRLREKARPIFEKIPVFEANMLELRGREKYPRWQ